MAPLTRRKATDHLVGEYEGAEYRRSVWAWARDTTLHRVPPDARLRVFSSIALWAHQPRRPNLEAL